MSEVGNGVTDGVLIVGAGPVGLVLACELLQQGVPVRLVDAERGHTGHSRANVVWPRNLELLDRIGVTGKLAARGHRLAGTAFYADRERIAAAYLSELDDTAYPFAVMIAQRDTERVLEERLVELGGAVERGVRLRALVPEQQLVPGRQRGDGLPQATLEHPDGRLEVLTPQWLLGADGAHSTVRTELGIGFTGPQVDVSFAITDARLSTTLADDLSHYCYSPHGAIVLGPMGDGVFRIAVNVPHDAYSDASPPPLELFQRLVDERAAGRTTVDQLLWSGAFRVRVRLAETFRRGRCFLVGDAAHVISPAGGQGMNTGLQDAFNLGWKLAGVIRGDLPASLLDSYDTERRATSHQVARSTALMTRAALAATPEQVARRDRAFRAADADGLFQRWMAPQMSQTDTHYGAPAAGPAAAGGPAARPEPGAEPDWLAEFAALVPSGEATPGGRLPLRLGGDGLATDRYTLLLWPGSRPADDWPSVAAGLRLASAGQAQVLDLGRDLDLGGDRAVPAALARALGGTPAAVLVRPDGHLQARTGLDPEQISAALAAVTERKVPAHAH
ncbi:FAD-dependent monooxygenase [Streptacidiphilus sp. PAMC 29251]